MPPKATTQTTLDSTSPAPKPPAKRKAKAKPNDGEDDDAGTSGTNGLSDQKLALPVWLKLFTERGVDMRLAMMLAGKFYSSMPSPAQVVRLNGPKMMEVGITDKDQKRSITNAIRGIRLAAKASAGGDGVQPAAGGVGKGKRKRNDEGLGNPLIPGDPSLRKGKAGVEYDVSDFDFHEIHDIEAIREKTVVTNRAPCMTAWAYIICEKMGFDRLEALSLASTFTSVTSTKHALALGNIYDPQQTRDAQLEMDELPRPGKKARTGEEEQGGHTQPWVSIMKRRPVIQRADGTWRGVSKGVPVEPYRAHSYITRNFRDATPHVIGALRILAQCYTVDELNEQGYGMYVSFRPDVEGWGDRATLYCSNIIDMIPPEKEVELVLGQEVANGDASGAKMVKMGEEAVKVEDIEQAEREDAAEVEQMQPVKEEGGFVKAERREDVFEGLLEAEYDE